LNCLEKEESENDDEMNHPIQMSVGKTFEKMQLS